MGNIIIHNISNKGDNISDSLFEVIDGNGTIFYTGITNSDGIIKINDLLVSSYCIRQKDINYNYLKICQ